MRPALLVAAFAICLLGVAVRASPITVTAVTPVTASFAGGTTLLLVRFAQSFSIIGAPMRRPLRPAHMDFLLPQIIGVCRSSAIAHALRH